MFQFLVNADAGLTAVGYGVCIAAMVLLVLGAIISGRNEARKLSTKQLVYCAAALALGFVTSYIKILPLPYGGSVTLFSMMFICLIGYWYGPRTGIMTGLSYGILQFIQEPFVLSFFQVCCDYILAFAALGLSGFFCKSKHGLAKGYIVGVLVRGLFHVIGGYLYWMDYMPENFPESLTLVYPIIYNYSYLLAEGVLTLAIMYVPAISKAMAQVKRNAIA